MKKVIAVVLDGFGIRDEVEGNAIRQALTPNFDKLWDEYPHTLLQASGAHVGLPDGQFGNSEVGHMALGAGRVVKQKETYIDELFENKELDNNENFINDIEYAKTNNKPIHLMQLISDGGVHSRHKHLIKMLETLKEKGIKNIFIHAITDGRDTDVHSSYKYIKDIQNAIKTLGVGKIASISGRYYAMDRDNKWDRTQKYYDLITRGIGIKSKGIMKTIQTCYLKNITDEFIPPILFEEDGLIKSDDVLIWLNYRPDRARQILAAFTNENFNEFRTFKSKDLKVFTLYPVDKTVKAQNLLQPFNVENPLGVYLAALGMTQARIAETEKYAHVTKFFDGETTLKLENCDQFLLPSPKIETYDLKPEMSALEVCKKAINCMEKDYDFILVNFANPDMVGHTGVLDAAIKAVQVVDLCLGKLSETAEDNFYTMFILSDHGNADIMINDEGKMVTTHTTSPVPFIITDPKINLKEGSIAQFAPTVLEFMDIAVPKEMKDTEPLIKKKKKILDI